MFYCCFSQQGLTEHLLDTDIAEIVPSLNTDESSAASLMLPESLQEYPCAPEKIELCCDANLRVVLQKVYKPDELVLVVFLTNQSQGNLPITNLVTVFEPPSNLKASFDSTNDNRFVDAELGPLSSVSKLFKAVVIVVLIMLIDLKYDLFNGISFKIPVDK